MELMKTINYYVLSVLRVVGSFCVLFRNVFRAYDLSSKRSYLLLLYSHLLGLTKDVKVIVGFDIVKMRRAFDIGLPVSLVAQFALYYYQAPKPDLFNSTSRKPVRLFSIIPCNYCW